MYKNNALLKQMYFYQFLMYLVLNMENNIVSLTRRDIKKKIQLMK